MIIDTAFGIPISIVGAIISGAGAITAFCVTIFSNRSLEKRKAELQLEIERHKWELSAQTEKLKGELSNESESYKFSLKKKEILFDKEIEAATTYFELYAKLEPRYTHPDKDWHEVLEETVEHFANMQSKLANYLAIILLSNPQPRTKLQKTDRIASEGMPDPLAAFFADELLAKR
jgi:hypothetical protein